MWFVSKSYFPIIYLFNWFSYLFVNKHSVCFFFVWIGGMSSPTSVTIKLIYHRLFSVCLLWNVWEWFSDERNNEVTPISWLYASNDWICSKKINLNSKLFRIYWRAHAAVILSSGNEFTSASLIAFRRKLSNFTLNKLNCTDRISKSNGILLGGHKKRIYWLFPIRADVS